MSPAQSEDSGLAADRGTTYATISIPRQNAQSMGIIFAGNISYFEFSFPFREHFNYRHLKITLIQRIIEFTVGNLIFLNEFLRRKMLRQNKICFNVSERGRLTIVFLCEKVIIKNEKLSHCGADRIYVYFLTSKTK